MARELIVYADESTERGPHYADFYGGSLVESTDLDEVVSRLEAVKAQENLHGEVKWGKVSANYLGKYKAVVDETFDLVAEGKLKMRVMFTHLYLRPVNLSEYHQEHSFQILYYHFLKHSFGLEFSNPRQEDLAVRYYLDRLPDTKEKNAQFKSYVHALEHYPPFRRARIRIPTDQIAEVRSHDHVVLQVTDIVLGSMQFRLNDRHKVKPEGSWRRGKKTIAKEKLYKQINKRIRSIYPHFNIGISTGLRGDHSNRWTDPYRHWCFTPREFEVDRSKAKGDK